MSSKAASKRPATVPSEPPNHAMVSEAPPERPGGRAPRSSRKGIAFGKRSNSMKRNPNAAVTKSGWLYKQASSGVKQWNKRWFVLVDRCLFYYKDEKEENILGSIPLLSFRVAAVQPSDNISRKHTFKVSGGDAGGTAAALGWHRGGAGDAGWVPAALLAFPVAGHGALLG
uniref:PH domain-containing protein n=1 Tax=Malurus cyaneus samueli TaxID=2593467 RepID=A0A8C5U9S2_9PASS